MARQTAWNGANPLLCQCEAWLRGVNDRLACILSKSRHGRLKSEVWRHSKLLSRPAPCSAQLADTAWSRMKAMSRLPGPAARRFVRCCTAGCGSCGDGARHRSWLTSSSTFVSSCWQRPGIDRRWSSSRTASRLADVDGGRWGCSRCSWRTATIRCMDIQTVDMSSIFFCPLVVTSKPCTQPRSLRSVAVVAFGSRQQLTFFIGQPSVPHPPATLIITTTPLKY